MKKIGYYTRLALLHIVSTRGIAVLCTIVAGFHLGMAIFSWDETFGPQLSAAIGWLMGAMAYFRVAQQESCTEFWRIQAKGAEHLLVTIVERTKNPPHVKATGGESKDGDLGSSSSTAGEMPPT